MLHFLIKTFITAIIIVSISELSKRFSFLSALLASLPLTSILAITWVYYEHREIKKIIELSYSIFWLVIPSLIFFIILPLCLKNGIRFIPSMVIATGSMSSIYALGIMLYSYIGK